jgi:hypothetical protein
MDSKTRYKPNGGFRFLDLFIIVFFISVAFVSLYLFRLDLLNTFRLQNVEPAGTVVIKKNTVQRRLGDRVIWDRLNTESPVYIGDLIRVAEISAATLYIKGNSIELNENTLIRIVPSPDGEGFQIIMTSGTVAVFAEEGAEKVSLNLNGQQIETEPGTVLRAAVPEKGEAVVKVFESVEKFAEEVPQIKIQEPRLVSPAVNSIIHYVEELPALNFQWTSVEEASSYILQVSNTPDFSNPSINVNTTAVFASVNNLGRGLWYWRVMLGLPPIHSGTTVFSNVSFFRLEQQAPGMIEPVQNGSISEWLAEEAPSAQLPPGVPREILMENSLVAQPTSAVQPSPSTPTSAQRTPPAPSLLSAPQIIQPAQRTTYGFEQLQRQKTIDFRWAAVRGANSYIFTLYEQTGNGRRQVLRTTINRGTRYTLENLRLLDRGTFLWQVEAVRMGRGNVIEQHGRTTDNIFILNFPVPEPVEIEDTGILYGNE